MSRPETREAIAQAAIRLFLDKGYQATSIADMRAASGATTGSIYHFFDNKAGVAVAIWEDAISGWRQAFEDLLPASTPEAQIRATAKSLLMWGRSNREHFAVYDEIVFLSRTVPEFANVVTQIEEGHAVSAHMYGDWAAQDFVAQMPWSLARALMIGPSLEVLRARSQIDDGDIARLSAAAWHAVRARPAHQPHQ